MYPTVLALLRYGLSYVLCSLCIEKIILPKSLCKKKSLSKIKNKKAVHKIENKMPVFNDFFKTYVLNFFNRKVIPNEKNMQVIYSEYKEDNNNILLKSYF